MAHQMLVKLTPVNFTNILQAAFALIFLQQKLQRQTFSGKKLHKTLSYKKAAHKMLVKLTVNSQYDQHIMSSFWTDILMTKKLQTGVNFINILCALFSLIFWCQKLQS